MEWFRNLIEVEAPTRSGTQKDRRLAQTSIRAFYEEVYKPAVAKTTFKERHFTTIDNWLQDMNIRPFTFDRYRCEVCFLGRQAESRTRNGTAQEGDDVLLAKYLSHQKIVKTQSAQVKNDKENVAPDQLCCVFDYSTFHDFTKQKVRKLETSKKKETLLMIIVQLL